MKIKKKNGLEFYSKKKTVKGKVKRSYRWHIYRQGRVIGASTEGYTRLQGAVNNAKSVGNSLAFNRIIEYAVTKYKSRKKN